MNWKKLQRIWVRFWMRWSNLTPFGRFATRLATWGAPPYKARLKLARFHAQGYVSPHAQIHHNQLHRQRDVFIGDNVIIYQNSGGGPVELHPGAHLYADIIMETGEGGQIVIGEETHIQARCQLSAYVGSIHIGKRVEIAPQCLFYPYNHGTAPGQPLRLQPLESKGDIIIGDDAWLGAGVTILANVHIGEGAIIGAGSVVTKDVPAHTVAVGTPARVVRHRDPSRNGKRTG